MVPWWMSPKVGRAKGASVGKLNVLVGVVLVAGGRVGRVGVGRVGSRRAWGRPASVGEHGDGVVVGDHVTTSSQRSLSPSYGLRIT